MYLDSKNKSNVAVALQPRGFFEGGSVLAQVGPTLLEVPLKQGVACSK